MDKFISPEDVCAIIPGMTKGQLAQLRYLRKGPKFYKPSYKKVLYEESEVLAWIKATGVETAG